MWCIFWVYKVFNIDMTRYYVKIKRLLCKQNRIKWSQNWSEDMVQKGTKYLRKSYELLNGFDPFLIFVTLSFAFSLSAAKMKLIMLRWLYLYEFLLEKVKNIYNYKKSVNHVQKIMYKKWTKDNCLQSILLKTEGSD